MPERIHIADRAAMAHLGASLAAVLRAGDVLVLTGNLGAGKTTFTQFLARGLDVRGRISSPTFVIAREHPPRGAGPGLVHVDAYRLGGADEFDDLGLDSSLDESVTVVEWGRGMAESLGDHLDIEILREPADPQAAAAAEPAGSREPDADTEPDSEDDEPRTVILTPVGGGWADRLAALNLEETP